MELKEIQGIYGPVWISEEGVQHLWAFQAFQRGDWKTQDGDKIEIIHRGFWNKGRGPDFKDAVIQIGEERKFGDVEIHIYNEDWWGHGHCLDSEYNNVILHCVLFAGRGLTKRATKENGTSPPVFLIGPWLGEDIDSVSRIIGASGEGLDPLENYLTTHGIQGSRRIIEELSLKRFHSKLSRVAAIQKGRKMEDVLKMGLLLVLGYPENRGLFYNLAEKSTHENIDIERCWNENYRDKVVHHGRPANHPNQRIKQFLGLSEDSRWESKLMGFLAISENAIKRIPYRNDTRFIRKHFELHKRTKELEALLSAGKFSIGFCHRLWSDLLMPLLGQNNANFELVYRCWFHGLPGDFPSSYRSYAQLLKNHPNEISITTGWIQGLYGLRDRIRIENYRKSEIG